jgi:hypothetical protein
MHARVREYKVSRHHSTGSLETGVPLCTARVTRVTLAAVHEGLSHRDGPVGQGDGLDLEIGAVDELLVGEFVDREQDKGKKHYVAFPF